MEIGLNSVSCLPGHKKLFSNDHQCPVMNDPTADPKDILPARDEKSKNLTPGHALGGLLSKLDAQAVCGRRRLVASTSHNYPQTATRARTSPSLCFESQKATRAGHISVAGLARELPHTIPPTRPATTTNAQRLPHCALCLLRRHTYLRSAAPCLLSLSRPCAHRSLCEDL